MSEIGTTNPKFPRNIFRRDGNSLSLGGMEGKIKFTSEKIPVDGGRGVSATTWTIEGVDEKFVDGADIEFEKKGSYTPCQLVNAANVVTDAPDGESYCCVMAEGWSEPKTYFFDGSKNEQMNWEKGMLIFWIALEKMRLTEFENPAYHDEMFTNIPDDWKEIPGYPKLDINKFRQEVNKLKEKVNKP